MAQVVASVHLVLRRDADDCCCVVTAALIRISSASSPSTVCWCGRELLLLAQLRVRSCFRCCPPPSIRLKRSTCSPSLVRPHAHRCSSILLSFSRAQTHLRAL